MYFLLHTRYDFSNEQNFLVNKPDAEKNARESTVEALVQSNDDTLPSLRTFDNFDATFICISEKLIVSRPSIQ